MPKNPETNIVFESQFGAIYGANLVGRVRVPHNSYYIEGNTSDVDDQYRYAMNFSPSLNDKAPGVWSVRVLESDPSAKTKTAVLNIDDLQESLLNIFDSLHGSKGYSLFCKNFGLPVDQTIEQISLKAVDPSSLIEGHYISNDQQNIHLVPGFNVPDLYRVDVGGRKYGETYIKLQAQFLMSNGESYTRFGELARG